MQTWLIEMSIPKSHMQIIYIFNSFFTFDNNLHTIQVSDPGKENLQSAFCLFLHIL